MVRSPREAMLPDAPLVHREGNLLSHKHIQRGNPAEAIAKSKYMLTQRFYTPWTEHAFLEPECAVAYPDGDGIMVLSTDQGAYDTQHEIMGMLGWPAERVKVRNCLVGGGFGGKEDVTVQHHAALAVRLLAAFQFRIYGTLADFQLCGNLDCGSVAPPHQFNFPAVLQRQSPHHNHPFSRFCSRLGKKIMQKKVEKPFLHLTYYISYVGLYQKSIVTSVDIIYNGNVKFILRIAGIFVDD